MQCCHCSFLQRSFVLLIRSQKHILVGINEVVGRKQRRSKFQWKQVILVVDIRFHRGSK